MNSLLNDIPSFPTIPSIAPLHLGITTRVLAKKQAAFRAKIKNTEKPNDEIRNRRRSSKFLEGTAIPNSVIKGEAEESDESKNKKLVKKERDEFVAKLLQRLEPQKKMPRSIYDEDVDRAALSKIKRELQRRSLLPIMGDNEDGKFSYTSSSANNKTMGKRDPWEELKEKRRISRRTSILAPLDGEKRPTYESIKKAIQNSKIIQQILDADKIEEQKAKEAERALAAEAQKEIAENQALSEEKAGKRESVTKERKVSKRKSSQKSDKFLNSPTIDKDKPLVKPKSSVESRMLSKRSTTSKTLKNEIAKESSLIIQNIMQQRRNTV